jgi:hypothetical protein
MPKHVTSLVVLTVAITGCAHPRSYFIHQEVVEIVPMKHSNTAFQVDRQEKKAFALGAAILSYGISFAYDQVVEQIQKEAKKYSAVSEAAKSGADFYQVEMDENTYKLFPLEGFTVKRRASSSTSQQPVDCYSFSLKLESSPSGESMRIVPNDFVFSSAKAKVASSGTFDRIFRNLTGTSKFTDEIDIEVRVILSDTFLDKDQLKSENIADFVIPIKSYSLGNERSRDISKNATSWFPRPRVSAAQIQQAAKQNKDRIEVGNFSLTISVKESNDMGQALSKAADRLKSKKETFLKEVVGEKGSETDKGAKDNP